MADCSMANSRLRMLVKGGLLWGFGLQHSDHKTSLYFKLTTSITQFNFWSENPKENKL